MSAWNAPPPTYDAPSSSTLTPYLQLPHLLSLTWLAYPILSLAFVAFRLQLSLASVDSDVASVKSDLLASCQAAEKAATAASSMPRYLAIASNNQFADLVNGSLNGARATLVLALTVMESVINFIIDLYRSTFLCFLELVVQGTLDVLIAAVNELNTLVTSAANGIRTSIQNDISSANSVIQTAVDAINKVNPFSAITAPTIPVPDLTSLTNVTLPDSFTQALTTLNSSIPSVSQLKDAIESIVDQPFELLKQDINDTFAGVTFDASVLPVPQLNTLTFCDELDLSIVDDVGQDLIKTAKIGTIILILLALLLIGLNCLLEWYKWRCMKRHLQYTREAWTSDPTMVHVKASSAPSVTLNDHNLMILNANSLHPLLTRIANNMSTVLRLSPTQHTHLQWFFHYVFHPPALACFLIGFIGLLSVEIQLLAMGPMVAKFQALSANATSDFSNTIFTAVNTSMYNQSTAYANDINSRVDAVQNTINNGVFGWVNVTTTTLNTTIVNFYNDVQNVVNTVFGGTILEAPADDFIKCFIGSKVDAIENVLTFLNQNLQINVPQVNQTVLVLSPASINEATQPIAAAAIGGGDGDGNNEGFILKLINAYAESLKKERVMFAVFLGLWGIVVLMALCIIVWNTHGRHMVEMRKRRKFEREQRAGIDGLIVPFRMSPALGAKGHPANLNLNAQHLDLPSFTPLPSPRGSAFRPFHFSRNASPAASRTDLSTVPSSESEAELGASSPGPGWGETFRQRFVAPPKNKLRAMRKSMGREQLVADQPVTSEKSDKVAGDSNAKGAAWFGRVATILDKKRTARARPQLRISISPPPADNSGEAPTRVLSSRFSSSPIQPTTDVSSSWRHLIKKSSPTQTLALPAVRAAPRHAPTDVEPSQEIPPLMPTPFAPPIHLGFDDSSSRYPMVPPNPFSPDRYRPPPPPMPSSVSEGEATPITRLLTNMNARQSAAVDPFVTPFDDEYRVTVAPPPHTRKSIPTNPFFSPPIAVSR